MQQRLPYRLELELAHERVRDAVSTFSRAPTEANGDRVKWGDHPIAQGQGTACALSFDAEAHVSPRSRAKVKGRNTSGAMSERHVPNPFGALELPRANDGSCSPSAGRRPASSGDGPAGIETSSPSGTQPANRWVRTTRGWPEHLQTCRACDVRARTFCSRLEARELNEIAEIRSTVTLAPDQCLFSEGDKARHVFNVRSGIMRAQKILPDGRRQIVGFLFAGDFLGMTDGTSYLYDIEAVNSAVLCRYPRQKLAAALKDFQTLKQFLFNTVRHELIAAQDQILLLGRKSALERVARFLMQLHRRHGQTGEEPGRISLPMRRNDIADYLGLTPETVCRVLSQLRKDRIISSPAPGTIQLMDLDRLRGRAQLG